MNEHNETLADIVAEMRRWGLASWASPTDIRRLADRIEAAARERIATPAEGMPPKRDAHRGAHPETAKSCLGTGEMENRQAVQIGETSGGGRAEAKLGTATAGAVPEPAKSLVNAAAMREAVKCLMDNLSIHLLVPSERITVNRAEMDGMVMVCEKALAAPARQCDVGTAEGQSDRLNLYCGEHGRYCDGSPKCNNCPLLEQVMTNGGKCELIWAQTPYEAEEGGAK